jgi:hypothetical protein
VKSNSQSKLDVPKTPPIIDSERVDAIPSPTRIANPALQSWLIGINLECVLNVLIDGGYDDMD